MKTEEEVQKRYAQIMKQSSMQFLFVPILAIGMVVQLVIKSPLISYIVMFPIVIYMLWFRLVIYRCPKCGHLFDRYQIYRDQCKHCKTKFGKR